jgi:ATP-binding cassette subfamily F protein 3
MDFNGSLILVSHDVDFLRPIASKVIDIRKGNLKTYLGDIDYFLSKRDLSSLERDVTITIKKEKSENINRKEQKRLEAELRQQKHQATKNLSKEITRYEEKITSFENEIKQLEEKLADPNIYSDGELTKDITNKFNKTRSELDNILKKWEALNEQLLEIRSQFN